MGRSFSGGCLARPASTGSAMPVTRCCTSAGPARCAAGSPRTAWICATGITWPRWWPGLPGSKRSAATLPMKPGSFRRLPRPAHQGPAAPRTTGNPGAGTQPQGCPSVSTDRHRTRRYHGHGRHRLGSLVVTWPNDGEKGSLTINPRSWPARAPQGSKHHQTARPCTQPRRSNSQAVNTCQARSNTSTMFKAGGARCALAMLISADLLRFVPLSGGQILLPPCCLEDQKPDRRLRRSGSDLHFLVAGAGFEPATSGL
jgi:hypothetical protein